MSKVKDDKDRGYNLFLLVAILLIGTFCTVLNQTILATALPTLMKAFDVSTSTVQWLTTGFLMVNGVMIPVSAWLSTRFNTKWLYIVAMSIFEVGTIIAWTAPTFSFLLVGRLIQALGVGISMPLLQNIMLSVFPANKRGVAMGMAGVVIGVAPAIGPTLSGFVIDTWHWRDLFGMIIPIVAIVIFLSFFYMKPVLKTTKSALDWLSLTLSTVGFGSLLYGFSSVGDNGWTSTIVLSTLTIGTIVIVLFIWRQLKLDKPFLELRVFSSAEFTIATILSSVVMVAMVGVEMIIPMYLQMIHGMTAFHSGLMLLPGALMMAIMSPITGKTFDRIGARRLAILGLFLLTVGTLPFIMITKQTPVLYIILLYALRMFGIAMVMMPATTAGMNALSIQLISHGTAVNNTVRQIASSIGTAILVSVLANTTKGQMPAKHLLHSVPLEYKVKAINATMTGYHAAFWIAVGFSVVGFGLAFFLSNKNKTMNQSLKNDKGGQA